MASGDVYFNYGSRIESKRLSEAISMPFGTGPICGFGSADINGNMLKVYPWSVGDENGAGSNNFTDPAKYFIRDLIRNHHLPRAEDADISAYRITFGCIAKDGILFRSGEASINNIPIEGSKGSHNQVLLFAEHKHVSEPVQNLVSFRAFWNESNFDFFNLYKESLDIYYPIQHSIRKQSISDKYDPTLSDKMSYDYLMNKVEAACSTYQSNQKTMVLIGIYGDGTNLDPENGKVEKFAIVPYGGKFPTPINYNSAIHSYFKESLKRMEAFLDYSYIEQATDSKTGARLNFNSLPQYLNWLLDQRERDIQKQIEAVALPPGSIILYDGVDIPKGWEIYDRAAGRIVIGYNVGGIQLNTTATGEQTILKNIGDTYDVSRPEDRYQITIKGVELPKHVHGIGLLHGEGAMGTTLWTPDICNFDNRCGDNGNFANEKGFRHHPITGIKDGAVLSGPNTTDLNDPVAKATKDSLILSKLPPAITLRYIKRITSK